MPYDENRITGLIKDYASGIGFDACGICAADIINTENRHYYTDWISNGYQADMDYLARNSDKRLDPRLLLDNAKSVICVALNYYPQQFQPEDAPQFAYYAYGKDYHDVMKQNLRELYCFIQSLIPEINGRVFCDTAPILERYWAASAGVGFIGKNSMLIIPQKGSYFFIGILLLDQILAYDKPLTTSCGNCTRCQKACPTNAFVKPYVLDSNKCISYQTIENRGEIDERIKPLLNNRLYGCDICQQVCPWNRFSASNKTDVFQPSEEFLSLNLEAMENLTEEDYRRIFRGSAVKRAKYSGLMRNLEALNQKP